MRSSHDDGEGETERGSPTLKLTQLGLEHASSHSPLGEGQRVPGEERQRQALATRGEEGGTGGWGHIAAHHPASGVSGTINLPCAWAQRPRGTGASPTAMHYSRDARKCDGNARSQCRSERDKEER